jgi:hypothetical protein
LKKYHLAILGYRRAGGERRKRKKVVRGRMIRYLVQARSGFRSRVARQYVFFHTQNPDISIHFGEPWKA